ncbi:glycoside hydrolase [Rhypophila sp. PSN 637]
MPTASLSVTLSQTYQTTDGFGALQGLSAGLQHLQPREPRRSQLIDLFFQRHCRRGLLHPSPNSTSDCMNTHLPTSPGSPAGKASYVWDGKDSGQLWVSQQAVKYGIKMFYSNAYMLSSGIQSAAFKKVLHSTLQNSPFSGKVQIACCGATGASRQGRRRSTRILGIITSHLYTSPINTTQPTALKVWQTETTDLVGKWSTEWYTLAINIHTALTTDNVSAYLWWAIINNDKLVLVEKGEYFVSKRFWAFAQYNRTVRPGAVRVGVVTDGNEELLLKRTGFVSVDGSVVVNVINTGVEDVGLSVGIVQNDLKVTDEGNDMSALEGPNVQGDGTVGGVSVPARGMVSFVIRLQA